MLPLITKTPYILGSIGIKNIISTCGTLSGYSASYFNVGANKIKNPSVSYLSVQDSHVL